MLFYSVAWLQLGMKGWRRLNHFQDLFKKLTSKWNDKKNKIQDFQKQPEWSLIYINLMVIPPLLTPPLSFLLDGILPRFKNSSIKPIRSLNVLSWIFVLYTAYMSLLSKLSFNLSHIWIACFLYSRKGDLALSVWVLPVVCGFMTSHRKDFIIQVQVIFSFIKAGRSETRKGLGWKKEIGD